MKRELSFFTPYVPLSFFIACALMAGIAFQESSLNSLWALTFPLILGSLSIIQPQKTIVTLALCAAFFAGSLSIFLHKQKFTSLYLDKKSYCAESPVLAIEKTSNPHWPYRIELQLPNTFSPHFRNSSFYLYIKKSLHLEIGDTVFYKDIHIKTPKESGFQRYLQRQGAVGTAFAKDGDLLFLHRPSFSYARWIHILRKKLIADVKKNTSRACFSLFCSLFLGERNQDITTLEKQKPFFKRWGISHHLARSGLHLLIFIILWHWIISFVPLSFFSKKALGIIITSIYFLLTPISVSFLRAFYVILLYKTCSLLNIQTHNVHLLSLVCIITLLCNPFQLFFLDFQLSFYLAFCLAWLSHAHATTKI